MTSQMRLESTNDSQLWRWMVELTQGDAVPLDSDDSPPWFEAGVVCEISVETYFDFLELLPPRWMLGSVFMFGEGTGPFRLFWRRSACCFARELTADETRQFCDRMRLPTD